MRPPPSLAALTRPVSRPLVQGATVDVETTTNTTPEGSAAGRFPWSKSYNLLRLFGILALICLGAAFAHSSCSATSALLSSQRYDSPLATVAKPFTPASPNGFCEVGGNDASSFAAIVSSDSAPANHPVRARSRVLVSASSRLTARAPFRADTRTGARGKH